MGLTERYLRQEGILSNVLLMNTQVSIIGVGSIGRAIACILAQMGIGHLQLIDFDTVEQVNLAPQGYLEEDIGLSKIDAVTRHIARINSEIQVEGLCRKFARSAGWNPHVFCCVDSIVTRKFMYEVLFQDLRRVETYIDCRMSAEALQVFTVYNDASQRHYEESFFDETERFEATCTQKSTAYCANIAAGIAVAQFTKRLRECPVEFEIFYNIFASDFIIAKDHEGA